MTPAEREQRKLEQRRIARARARELDRLPDHDLRKPPPRRSKSGRPDSKEFKRLPAGPLVRVVDRHFAHIEIPGTRFTTICGTSERRLRDWRKPGALVAFDRADMVLCELHLNWRDVWTEENSTPEELALVEYAFTGEGPLTQGAQLALEEVA